jgi:hypothetical protein
MFKRDITYEDFNDVTRTETLYFNLSGPEIIELEADYEGGFMESIQKVIKANDNKTLIAEFKKIILMAYGIKSEDGLHFEKSDEIRNKFTQTAAYNALYMELVTDANAASAFVIGVIPKEVQKLAQQQALIQPPQPPVPPQPPANPLTSID